MHQLKSGPAVDGSRKEEEDHFFAQAFFVDHTSGETEDYAHRRNAQRARPLLAKRSLLGRPPSFPPEPSPVTLKASLASAMIARWQLLRMRSACAQPIPSNALLAHQQPCLPPPAWWHATFC
jgi:hypothetical protein